MREQLKEWWQKHHKLAILVIAVKMVVKVGILMLVFNRCATDNNDVKIDLGEDYYPLEAGNYITYELDSITYDDFFNPIKVDTSYWDVREYFESEFIDDLGRNAIRIERSIKPRGATSWQLSNIWYAVKSNSSVEKVEDNQRYIKLVFPANLGREWDGNRYIATVDELSYLSGWDYNIKEREVVGTINGILYGDILSVEQANIETAISKVYSIERFARDIGMVYKELWNLESQTGIGTPWPGRTEKGFIIVQRASGYGKM